MATFYVPAVNWIGRGCIKEIGSYVKDLGYKKTLLLTDEFLLTSDILPKVTKPLDEVGVEYVVFSHVDPNPTYKMSMIDLLF